MTHPDPGPDRGSDDVLTDLDAALNVEPSRAFADGVRARVARASNRTQAMWWGLAAAAGIGLAMVLLWRPVAEPTTVITSAFPDKPGPVVQRRATADRVASPASPATADVVRRPADRLKPVMAQVAATAATSEPRLEVITNQGAVLRALWADYQGRPMLVAEGEPAVDGLTLKTITVDDIVVAPIVVVEMGKDPVSAGGTPIIRRANATKETR